MCEDDREALDSLIEFMILLCSGIFSYGVMESCWLWMIIYPVGMFLYNGFFGQRKSNERNDL